MTFQDPLSLPTKEIITTNFNDNAHLYDDVAIAQRKIATRVCEILVSEVAKEPIKTPIRILDAGCGTGYIGRYLHTNITMRELLGLNQRQLVALDISAAMLEEAKRDNYYDTYVKGDIESLPFENGSFDLAISSLAMQWCHDFTKGIEELLRVTNEMSSPRVFISTLLDGTFYELQEAFSLIDNEAHILSFIREEKAREVAKEFGGSFTAYDEVVMFPSLKSLFASIRNVGASTLSNRRKGLLGRESYRKLEHYFQTLGKYQLTYRVAIFLF